MARAHSLYVVENIFGQPVAGFTVKHECISYLRRNEHLTLYVNVLRDGGGEVLRRNVPAADFAA